MLRLNDTNNWLWVKKFGLSAHIVVCALMLLIFEVVNNLLKKVVFCFPIHSNRHAYLVLNLKYVLAFVLFLHDLSNPGAWCVCQTFY